MKPGKGLGRGLASLIPSAAAAETQTGRLRRVPVDKIFPNRWQPRMEINEEELEQLAASIRQDGLQQPIVVSGPAPDGRYEIIAGERRWRAVRKAGFSEVEVIVREAGEQDRLVLALVENMQRADLNPLDTALAYRRLEEEFGLTQEEIARRVGKSRTTVANAVRLLDLSEDIQTRLRRGELTEGHSRALLMMEDGEDRRRLAARTVQEKLTVREVESLAAQITDRRKVPRRRGRTAAPELQSLERELQQRWGTRVSVRGSPRAGRIVIYYFGLEELERIAHAMRSSSPTEIPAPDPSSTFQSPPPSDGD